MGSIRVSYFKNNGGSAEVLEENNYYPFGLKYQGYNQAAGNPAYNYQYNGKELQKETGWSDYGARMYMSDIGRWGVIDPLAEQMRRFTPYNYAYNNPVSFTDPDGRKPMSWEDEQNNIMTKVAPEGSLWWIYASGNHVGAGMQGGGDGIGDFFGQMKIRSGGGGGSGPGPKSSTGPGIIQKIGNFFSNLFGGKKSTATGHAVKATIISMTLIPEGVAEGSIFSSLQGVGTGLFSTAGLTAGAIFVPTMIGEPEFNWTRQFDVPTDIPITTTGEPSGVEFFYRAMSSKEYLSTGGFLQQKRDQNGNYRGEGPFVTDRLEYAERALNGFSKRDKYDLIVQYSTQIGTTNLLNSISLPHGPGITGAYSEKVGLPIRKVELGGTNYGFYGSNVNIFNIRLVGPPIPIRYK
ncbi:RHS repeat domain-containing protein [Chryseobacterium sp. sg2396]|uniref:RHS repeat domain-containing protein n=1 Tax=Chryseobacterium sp. sg2396 TaxID=3276280 RepID=UPI00366D0D91